VLFLRAFALRQIENESDTLMPVFFEGCRADQHGNTAAVFPEILFLVRLRTPGLHHLGQPLSYIDFTPSGGVSSVQLMRPETRSSRS
jgi:hypothetical protein